MITEPQWTPFHEHYFGGTGLKELNEGFYQLALSVEALVEKIDTKELALDLTKVRKV